MKPYPPKSLAGAVLIATVALVFGTAVTAAEFYGSYQHEGIGFWVRSANDTSRNRLTIATSGLKDNDSPITIEVDGTVTGADVADLDNDGSPEIYIYVHSAGSGSYGSLVAFAVNARESLSPIYLPPVSDDRELSKGYMGHDQFGIVDDALIRRFPVYRDADTNSRPTGGQRQLHYGLKPGEAGWILHLDQVLPIEPE